MFFLSFAFVVFIIPRILIKVNRLLYILHRINNGGPDIMFTQILHCPAGIKRVGSSVPLDPILCALAGLEGLDNRHVVGSDAVDHERVRGEFVDFVLHFICSPLFCCTNYSIL